MTLPTSSSFAETTSGNDLCAVCHDPLTHELWLGCGHIVCAICVTKLIHSKVYSCPLCRAQIDVNKLKFVSSARKKGQLYKTRSQTLSTDVNKACVPERNNNSDQQIFAQFMPLDRRTSRLVLPFDHTREHIPQSSTLIGTGAQGASRPDPPLDTWTPQLLWTNGNTALLDRVDQALIGIQPAERTQGGGVNYFAFVLDISSSMGRPTLCRADRCSRLGLALASLTTLLKKLTQAGDQYLFTVFDAQMTVIRDWTTRAPEFDATQEMQSLVGELSPLFGRGTRAYQAACTVFDIMKNKVLADEQQGTTANQATASLVIITDGESYGDAEYLPQLRTRLSSPGFNGFKALVLKMEDRPLWRHPTFTSQLPLLTQDVTTGQALEYVWYSAVPVPSGSTLNHHDNTASILHLSRPLRDFSHSHSVSAVYPPTSVSPSANQMTGRASGGMTSVDGRPDLQMQDPFQV